MSTVLTNNLPLCVNGSPRAIVTSALPPRVVLTMADCVGVCMRVCVCACVKGVLIRNAPAV